MHAAAQGPETTGRHRRIDAGTTLTETGRHRAVSAEPQAAPAAPRYAYGAPDLPPPPPLVTPRTPRYAASELPPPPPLHTGSARTAGQGRPAAQHPTGQRRRPEAASTPRQRTGSRLTTQIVACSALVVMALAPVLARSGTGLGLHDAVAAEVAAVPDRADDTLAELERGSELSGSTAGIGDAYSRPSTPGATPDDAAGDSDTTVIEVADAGPATDQPVAPADAAADPSSPAAPAPVVVGQPVPDAPTSGTPTSGTPQTPGGTPKPVTTTPVKPTPSTPTQTPTHAAPTPVVTTPAPVPVLTEAPPIKVPPLTATPTPSPTDDAADSTAGLVGDLLGG
ncbi:hypothetical protein [Modestobacter roseus]|uniref:hypothetical protein n=1 Tax=Modestobacter roseus TaxID=1181884 RepID=UPI0034DEF35F